MEIFTIGFTQTTAEQFFARLKAARVERLLDVRLNNSSQLAGFAKAQDLPYFLRELVGATLELLERVADDDLEDIFGPDLYRPSKWRYAVDAGRGSASLGVLRAERPELSIDNYGRPTLRLSAPELPAYARVTDVRFFADDQVQVREDVVDDVQRRLERGVRAFAMVGLSRAFADDAGFERHWLQVNGICLADRPLGERP